jgi:hypothetical protein
VIASRIRDWLRSNEVLFLGGESMVVGGANWEIVWAELVGELMGMNDCWKTVLVVFALEKKGVYVLRRD